MARVNFMLHGDQTAMHGNFLYFTELSTAFGSICHEHSVKVGRIFKRLGSVRLHSVCMGSAAKNFLAN